MKKLLATTVLLASAAAAHASTASVYGVASAVYTPDFSSSIPNPDLSINTGTPGVYAIDLYVTFSTDNSLERSFGNVVSTITFSGNSLANNATYPGWIPYNPIVDTNGSDPDGQEPLFFLNADVGTPGDLKYLLISVPKITSPNPADPRIHIGEGAGTKFGTIYVNWDGIGMETLNIEMGGVSYASAVDASLIFDPNATQFNTSLTFGVPEPASLGLLGIAGLGLLARRRNA